MQCDGGIQLSIHSANEVKKLASSRKMVHSPAEFDGSLEKFVDEFVLPNLPSREIVAFTHRVLVDFCKGDNPLFLIRQIKGTTRSEVYFTETGARFKATDNAPAWWMHFVLFHEIEFSESVFPTIVSTMPTHLFEVGAHLPHSINSAGWHVAHIGDVKNGQTDFRSWDRDELAVRFLRNVHPCNYFFLSKQDWQKWGADNAVIGFFASLYVERYREVWNEFITVGRIDASRFTRSSDPVRYHYGSIPEANGPQNAKLRKTTVLSGQSVVQRGAKAATTYSASRLVFKADVIEPLKDWERFRIVTPKGSYEMSKADFVRAFAKVRATKSYCESRIYSYPKAPVAAAEFLVAE